MLSKTEIKVLKRLFDDLVRSWTIREISLDLGLPYPQIHRSVSGLLKKGLVIMQRKGKSAIISLNFDVFNDDYVTVETERKRAVLSVYSKMKILDADLNLLKQTQFICILFGSYADRKAKKESDIDLLFVIPEEYDYGRFEREVKTRMTLPQVDINITTEKGLIDMWNTPSKLNVGNELLKKHVVLRGAEQFLHMRVGYYVG